jgi:hypothetical protein
MWRASKNVIFLAAMRRKMRTELTFQQAIKKFKDFLASIDQTTNIVWIFYEDVQVYNGQIYIQFPISPENEKLAEEDYERGRDKGLGLGLEVKYFDDTLAYCSVFVPTDEQESEALMLVELKLSCVTSSRPVKRVGRGIIGRQIWKYISKRSLLDYTLPVRNRRVIPSK